MFELWRNDQRHSKLIHHLSFCPAAEKGTCRCKHFGTRMSEANATFALVCARIALAAAQANRAGNPPTLLAVSKRQPAAALRALAAAGQTAFGENYVQEALPKMAALADLNLSWHFIGRIQRNKTRDIAANFDWVHTLDRAEIATRLSAQRPATQPALQCLIEVNVSGEASKAGVDPAGLPALVALVRTLPRLTLRGLMCLPTPTATEREQRLPFRQLRELRDALGGPGLEELSMGTSADFAAAIAEGATLVRIGTALFGPRSAN